MQARLMNELCHGVDVVEEYLPELEYVVVRRVELLKLAVAGRWGDAEQKIRTFIEFRLGIPLVF